VREEERQRQAVIERQQREGYTYEWVHTQVQHVAESPAPSNRRSVMLAFILQATRKRVSFLSCLCLCVNNLNVIA